MEKVSITTGEPVVLVVGCQTLGSSELEGVEALVEG